MFYNIILLTFYIPGQGDLDLKQAKQRDAEASSRKSYKAYLLRLIPMEAKTVQVPQL